MYLPEDGKPPHLPMFEIRAAYVGRTISFFLLSLLSRSHQPPLSRAAARVSRPEELGEGELVEGPLARGGWWAGAAGGRGGGGGGGSTGGGWAGGEAALHRRPRWWLRRSGQVSGGGVMPGQVRGGWGCGGGGWTGGAVETAESSSADRRRRRAGRRRWRGEQRRCGEGQAEKEDGQMGLIGPEDGYRNIGRVPRLARSL
ncbi:hypothetical protein PVAP13_2NG602140 [Panicum virgatum]|uniref:Uncharacterized protein n=1 Tax=Panicum virgatum TaxID=38727 RepID=A0A8T0VZG6_PANVG|nr:hypothetical protein PVAP13_2NG602140 [Panicum virgatum]